MTFANVPPTLSLVLTSDLVIYLILRATGPETMEQDTGLLVAPGAMEDPAFPHRLEMIMTSAGKIIAQDMHVDCTGAGGPALALRHARPLLLAGGRPGPVQPLARAPLPRGMGSGEDGETRRAHRRGRELVR